MQRCGWVGSDPLSIAYHDAEWGVPEDDPRALFEALTLEAFQSGLSWITILKKRENFRRAFEGFDPATVARYGAADVARLCADAGIVRHRGKIEATIGNARAWCDIEAREGFSTYLWSQLGNAPIQNAWRSPAAVPAQTPLSRAISAALKARGFHFVGPTIVYSFMQAAGMVNDHEVTCPRHAQIARRPH